MCVYTKHNLLSNRFAIVCILSLPNLDWVRDLLDMMFANASNYIRYVKNNLSAVVLSSWLLQFVVNGFISLFSKIVVQAWKCDGFSVRSAKFLLVFSFSSKGSLSVIFFDGARSIPIFYQYYIRNIVKGRYFSIGTSSCKLGDVTVVL